MCQFGKAYVLVEGQGDVLAVGNLLARLSADQGATLAWSAPARWPNLHLEHGLRRGAEFVRSKQDVRALLVLRDEDDAAEDRVRALEERLRNRASRTRPSGLDS